MNKKEFQDFLSKPLVKQSLPIHATFWEITERDQEALQGEDVIAARYITNNHNCSIFYKSISQCIDLIAIPQKKDY